MTHKMHLCCIVKFMQLFLMKECIFICNMVYSNFWWMSIVKHFKEKKTKTARSFWLSWLTKEVLVV